MQNFIELLKDHTLILAATSHLSATVSGPRPQPEGAYDALRRIARLLETHLRDEEEFLGQDRDHGRQEFTALAEEHGERFDHLVEEWDVYLREWTEENIRADWTNFARATAWMMQQVDAQVEAENQSLYPAALRYGLIRLLPEKVRAA